MYPKGIIYQASTSSERAREVKLHAPFGIRLLYAVLQTTGLSILAAAIYFCGYIFAPAAKEEVVYAAHQAPIVKAITASDVKQIALEDQIDKVTEVQNLASEWGVDSQFSIIVPKINAKAKVIPNVDVSNQRIYLNALKEGVAHAQGTNFPGEGKMIYLFSHSTNSPWEAVRLDAVFYLLNKLEKNDRVTIFFADKKYDYAVADKAVVSASDTSWLHPKENNQETLILQTCTPPGTNWKRLLVIAKPIL